MRRLGVKYEPQQLRLGKPLIVGVRKLIPTYIICLFRYIINILLQPLRVEPHNTKHLNIHIHAERGNKNNQEIL